MRKRNLSKNYIINTVYQLLSVFVPVFILPHLSKALGAEGIGFYGFNFSLVSYFIMLATLGSGTFGQREIAYNRGDKEAVSKIFWEVQLFRCFTSIVSLLIYFCFILYWGRNKIALLILAPNLINVLLDVSWFWSGLEEFSILASRFAIAKILYVFAIFSLIKNPDDLYLYLLIEVLLGFVSYALLWGGIRKRLIKVSGIKPFRHWKNIIILFIPSLAMQLYTVLDKTMLGMFAQNSYVENGYYEQAQGMIKSCMVLVTSLVTVMSPAISYCFAHREREKMKKYLYLSYRYAWFVTIALCCFFFVLSDNLISIYLGPDFSKTALLLKVCCPLFSIIGLSNITGLQYFVPCNYIRHHIGSLLVGSATNIILNLILIPRFQSVGASVASVVAELCVTVTQFWYISRIGELKIHKILLSSSKYLIAGIIMGFSASILVSLRQVTWLYFIVIVCASLCVYLIVLIILRDKMILDFLHKKTIQITKIEEVD